VTGISKATVLHSPIITARFSQAGLAMNLVIDKWLHTVPMRSLTPVLTGWNRERAPLFVPKEAVAPD
jgi:hypothetical protein